MVEDSWKMFFWLLLTYPLIILDILGTLIWQDHPCSSWRTTRCASDLPEQWLGGDGFGKCSCWIILKIAKLLVGDWLYMALPHYLRSCHMSFALSTCSQICPPVPQGHRCNVFCGSHSYGHLVFAASLSLSLSAILVIISNDIYII